MRRIEAGDIMDQENALYLQPSELCDFDRHPEIKAKALQLASGCSRPAQKFQRVFFFVKELPYGLEDWDVPASETLAKGWGMCSGKTNLLVAMLRSLGIPARYRVYGIRAETSLWASMTVNRDLAQLMGPPPAEQDHVDCEVWLDSWRACDPARDTALELGLMALGITLERQPVAGASGRVKYLRLASLEGWASERQQRRAFREGRSETFARVNEHLGRIRALGREKGEPEARPPDSAPR